MIKMLLFSASLLLVVSTSALAQEQATPPVAVAQAESPFALGFSPQGGNYLGVVTAEVTRENMGRYNMREPRGVAITRVAEDSPASRAGLKAGDVILRFDNEPVTTHNKLQRLISEAAPEQAVRLGISRGGAEQEVTVTVGRRQSSFQSVFEALPAQPNAEEARRAMDALRNQQGMSFFTGRRIGVSTTELTKQLADYFGVAGGRGVLVTTVAENSPASRAGLKAGDVITEADGEKVESSGDLSRVINRKSEGVVTLRVMRDRNPMTLTVTPEKRETGAITVSPELLEIETGALEIKIPQIIELPQIAPIRIAPVKLPKVKISPKQLEQLRKLENLKLDELMML